MTTSRLIAGVLLAASVAGFVSPCLAAGDDPHLAMACCKKMGHSDCGQAHVAQACCQTNNSGNQDRLTQLGSEAARQVVTVSLALAAVISTVPTALSLPVSLAIVPTRSDGLAARARPLRI